jgi:malate dehydrogenase (oxaloacetate-decarboxylating)(NADP+)
LHKLINLTLDLLCELGFQKSNILLVDSKGVINKQRENLTQEKLNYVSTTNKQTKGKAQNIVHLIRVIASPCCHNQIITH